jgi:hypothetical protein
MSYENMCEKQQTQTRDYLEAVHNRLQTYRDGKETLAFAGLAIFLGAVATALTSKDWPPTFAQHRPLLIVGAFSLLWLFVAVYLRYQLRRRRWAALRVAGCDWLLAEWLPDSPRAMVNEDPSPKRSPKPRTIILLIDIIWPLKSAVIAVDPNQRVYTNEIERSWILASKRGTDALLHERLIHIAGWLGYGLVLARTLLA